ncbi:hypothetical protein Dimus_018344, partial [Dionaea muscipula]
MEASCARLYPHAGDATDLAKMANHDHGGDELAVRGVLGLRLNLGELHAQTSTSMHGVPMLGFHEKRKRTTKLDKVPEFRYGHFIAAK